MISVPSLLLQGSSDETELGFNLENSQVSFNMSDYVNFTGPPIDAAPPHFLEVFMIFIDDSDPNYNWSKTAAENAWCSGSGISSDPYVIEGLFIDGQGVGGGIFIKHSTKHFIIRNCWVNNSGTHSTQAGVLVSWSENGIIQDNIFGYTEKGVYILSDCKNITVIENYMISNPSVSQRAFAIDGNCENIVAVDNIIINFRSPMYLANVANLTLRDNYITNFIYKEWEDPPVIFDIVNDSKVTHNILDGVYAQTGVFVEVLGGSNNTVMNNTVVGGGVDVPDTPVLSQTDRSAVNLQNCNNNLVAHNRILSRSDTAIPGYDTLLLLSLFGVVFTVLIIKISMKKLKS